jgi:hypothetical protein
MYVDTLLKAIAQELKEMNLIEDINEDMIIDSVKNRLSPESQQALLDIANKIDQ